MLILCVNFVSDLKNADTNTLDWRINLPSSFAWLNFISEAYSGIRIPNLEEFKMFTYFKYCILVIRFQCKKSS